ncbi:recombinase family protein [Staphylococcus cohnii]
MIFGYARVSTDDQNLSLQIDALTHYCQFWSYMAQILFFKWQNTSY